jgi:hypothetical protein
LLLLVPVLADLGVDDLLASTAEGNAVPGVSGLLRYLLGLHWAGPEELAGAERDPAVALLAGAIAAPAPAVLRRLDGG